MFDEKSIKPILSKVKFQFQLLVTMFFSSVFQWLIGGHVRCSSGCFPVTINMFLSTRTRWLRNSWEFIVSNLLEAKRYGLPNL